MRGELATGRTFTSPAWGESLGIVERYRPAWMTGEWTSHLGTMIALFTAVFLLLGYFDALLDWLFGGLTSGQFATLVGTSWRQNFVIALLGATAFALVARWQEHRLKRWLAQQGAAMPIEGAQAEVFTQGVYAAGHPFVNGAHPFYRWDDMVRSDFTFSRSLLKVAIKLREGRKPIKLKLSRSQADEILSQIEGSPAVVSPLGLALLRHRDAVASGHGIGRGSAP